MTIVYLACLNNEPVIQSLLGPKCNPVGGEPLILMEYSFIGLKITNIGISQQGDAKSKSLRKNQRCPLKEEEKNFISKYS